MLLALCYCTLDSQLGSLEHTREQHVSPPQATPACSTRPHAKVLTRYPVFCGQQGRGWPHLLLGQPPLLCRKAPGPPPGDESAVFGQGGVVRQGRGEVAKSLTAA